MIRRSGNDELDEVIGVVFDAAMRGQEREIKSSFTEFEDYPDICKILIKRLEWSGLPVKISNCAALLLGIYSDGLPGAVMVLFLKCLMTEKVYINLKTVMQVWPVESYDTFREEINKIWKRQKIKKRWSDNLIDSVDFWEDAYKSGETAKSIFA